jgi:hypothetical protein
MAYCGHADRQRWIAAIRTGGGMYGAGVIVVKRFS